MKEAFFFIDLNKSPGLDGFSTTFFKEFWTVVSKDLFLAMNHALKSNFILGGSNATHIYLIPKKNPTSVKYFRPIACCNVWYKSLSKILANRLKNVTPSLIGQNHMAFILGRNIQDSLLVAHELIRGYSRKHGSKKCAIKVDIQRAYDVVNWRALLMIYKRIGIPEKMIN